MQVGFAIFIFAFGLIVGSFLNVLIFRLNTGESVVRGRSRCFSCGRMLGVVDLIPVVSFLVQRGRCRSCGSKISAQYLLVELATGLVFLLVAYRLWDFNAALVSASPYLFLQGVFLIMIFSLLIAIGAYDLRHMIIPNQFVYPFIVLSFFYSAISYKLLATSTLYPDILSGLAAFGFFAGLWFVSKGRWMGFGDAKLALGIGFLLGPLLTPLAIVLAFWLGVLISVPIVLKQGGGLKTQVPFGPFLVLATVMSWYAGADILSWYFSLF